MKKSLSFDLRAFLHQGIKFFLGSLAGVTADLSIFELLIRMGAHPSVANTFSSAVGVTIVYFLATKYAFDTARSKKTYFTFVAWYAFSILTFSVLIGFAAHKTGLPPIVCKVASLPFSFAANFAFSKVLFRKIPKTETALA